MYGRREKRGREAGPQGGGEREKKGKITQRCVIFRNRKNANRREPTNTGRESELKVTGSERFKPPCNNWIKEKCSSSNKRLWAGTPDWGLQLGSKVDRCKFKSPGKKQSARATRPLIKINQRDPKPVTETVCHVKDELTN